METLNSRYEYSKDAKPLGKGSQGYVFLAIDKEEADTKFLFVPIFLNHNFEPLNKIL